jgi:hypothetical protein
VSEDEAAFQRTVAEYIAEGLHTRRGLTAEEYTAVCRRAWEGCRSSPEFPFKVLRDPLASFERMLANSSQEYVHWRVADELDALRGPSTEIECHALGKVKPDLSTGRDDSPPPPTEEPQVPERRLHIVAVFDVLGFSALLQEKGLPGITALYSRLISEAVTKEAMRTYTILRLSKTQMGSILGVLPVRHAHFSDTIFLWVPLVQHFIGPFMARCADMVCEALNMGLPLRGALAVGPAVMHSRSGTFVGAPIVEAARLEQAQDWFGVSLGPSMLAADVSREFDPNLVIPYAIPFKKGKTRPPIDLALDWPSRFRSRFGADPIDSIQAIDRSPAHRIYYTNAAKFAEFSAGPVFRSEGLQRPNLGELADAALQARRTGEPLKRQHQFMLKDLSRTGPAGDAVASFVRSIAAGKEAPGIPTELPSGMQRYLQELSLATGGSAQFVKLIPCVVECVYVRLCGSSLSEGTLAMLAELEELGRDGQKVARFLRAFVAGGEVVVPRGLPHGMGPMLKDTLAWVSNRRVPSGLVRHVAEDCLKARLGYEDLGKDALCTLAAIDSTSDEWHRVAVFLRGIAAGQDADLPTEIPETVENDLVRLQLSSRLAGVQPPRMLEIVSVGFGDPHTGINLFALAEALLNLRERAGAIPNDAEAVLREFEASSDEHAIVAHRLRSLVAGAETTQDVEQLPLAIRLILAQLDALANNRPIPIDPFPVGMAAIRSRHGGGSMGDCVLFSLHAMARADVEARRLAGYFWRIANGGPAGPVPPLTSAPMVAIADEVRCLADKEVGGIRLLMKQAESRQKAQPLGSV